MRSTIQSPDPTSGQDWGFYTPSPRKEAGDGSGAAANQTKVGKWYRIVDSLAQSGAQAQPEQDTSLLQRGKAVHKCGATFLSLFFCGSRPIRWLDITFELVRAAVNLGSFNSVATHNWHSADVDFLFFLCMRKMSFVIKKIWRIKCFDNSRPCIVLFEMNQKLNIGNKITARWASRLFFSQLFRYVGSDRPRIPRLAFSRASSS